MVRMCRNCKYYGLNGGHCLIKAFSEPVEQICNYHEFIRGALEKQARLKKQEEVKFPGFMYGDTDSVTNVKG